MDKLHTQFFFNITYLLLNIGLTLQDAGMRFLNSFDITCKNLKYHLKLFIKSDLGLILLFSTLQ